MVKPLVFAPSQRGLASVSERADDAAAKKSCETRLGHGYTQRRSRTEGTPVTQSRFMHRVSAPPMRAEKWAAHGRTTLPVSTLPEEHSKTPGHRDFPALTDGKTGAASWARIWHFSLTGQVRRSQTRRHRRIRGADGGVAFRAGERASGSHRRPQRVTGTGRAEKTGTACGSVSVCRSI
jgi:hypothetical protein